MKKNRRIQLTMHNAQLTIITAIIATMLMAACSADTEPTNQVATVSIAATAQQLLPQTRGGAPMGAEGFDGAATRAPGDIKTAFYPGDVITLNSTPATLQPDGTWNTTLAFPLDAAITIAAEYDPTGPDPLTATATTTDGTITLGIDPTTGQPQWNINLSFTHKKAVVDVIVLTPQMENITTLMQAVTINSTTSNTSTDILLPAPPPPGRPKTNRLPHFCLKSTDFPTL